MSRWDGAWLCQLEGYPTVSTDDLTLDEVDIAERVCDVPYTLLNPHAGAKQAKALFVLLMMRGGLSESRALEAAGKVPLRQLAAAFTYVEAQDVPPPTEEGDQPPDPPSSAPTSDGG